MSVQQGSLDWIKTIEEAKGYAPISASVFLRLIDRTESYEFFSTLLRHVRSRQLVLEAGCGWALSSFALARRNVHVTALDISGKLIEDLARMKDELGWKHVFPVKGDIFRLAEATEKYDVIFSDGTYEHFRDEERRLFLRNVRDSLVSGGKFIVSVPNAHNPFFNVCIDRRMPWMRPFTPASLRDELLSNGFTVTETGYSFVNPGFGQWMKSGWMIPFVHAADVMFGLLPAFARRICCVHFHCVAVSNPFSP